MHIPVLIGDVWHIVRRFIGSRRAIAALVLGAMVLDCSDAILDGALLDGALTAAIASSARARGQADVPTVERETPLRHVSSARSEGQRAPVRESVPTPRAPHAPCPCASAVPLSLPPELPRPAMRDNTSRPAPGDFTLPHGPAPELRLRPPVAFLG